MYKQLILMVVFVFLIGWVSNSLYTIYLYPYLEKGGKEQGISVQTPNNDLAGELERIQLQSKTKDRPSPAERVDQENIFVYDDEVVIKLNNSKWAVFSDSKSMDPVLDSTSKALEIVPKSEQEINVGDIIAYKSKYRNALIVHRVIEIGHDPEGWYARLRGDNNDYTDPERVRFGQIKRVIVAVIY